MRLIDSVVQSQRGALMPWSAVCLGLGVAIYFSFAIEPRPALFAALGPVVVLAAWAAWRWPEGAGPWAIAAIAVAIGLGAAGYRGHSVAGPVLSARYYGPIEGTIVAVDRSASDALRLTLADVRLARRAPDATPVRVRVSLFGDQGYLVPEPGSRVFLTGHLSPPGGPAEPGGFDFQRHAWFLGLGGVGYTRSPVLLLEPRAGGAHALTHLRLWLSRAVQDRVPGQPGAFAAAVTTGDRSGLSPETLEVMRGSNIAHLLAISGLHMGLLTGFVYGALRLGFAAIPALVLRFPVRKWAAGGAFMAAAFYLALSGGNVATERAFVQVAVMLVAVMLDRRAITLRSVAIAAIIVLLRRPETLLSPGFQMSFAATAALVAVFTGLRGARWLADRRGWQRWLFALVTSSVVAGAATAPFAAAQFNIIAAYGLAANLVAVPIMGAVVVPAAVAAAILAPFGLAGPALWVMEQGLAAILAAAATVTSWPDAVRGAVTPPPGLMVAIVLGGLVLILWQGRARWLGALPVVIALALWPGSQRPGLLIASTGGLVGVVGPEGRSLSRSSGDGFVAGIWLENDGDRLGQAEAAARAGWQPDGTGVVVAWSGLSIWHATGQRGAAGAAEACARHDLVILNTEPSFAPAGPLPISLGAPPGAECRVITPEVLAETGAIAADAGGITTARDVQGARLWSDPGVRAAWGYQ
ncbi:MAG: ComEC/Rec2 family competence protein [Pseudomonadota bacterium]